MNKQSSFGGFCRSPISCFVTAMLVVLALGGLVSCSRKNPATAVEIGQIGDAAQNGDLEKVKALLNNYPDLIFSTETHGCTPLIYAASYDRKSVVEFLLAKNADISAKDHKGQTALHYAAANGDGDIAELLLASHANVNARDNTGGTPLHWAAVMGRKNLVKLLLANQADINATNSAGWTPLRLASDQMRRASFSHVQESEKEVADILRQHGGHE